MGVTMSERRRARVHGLAQLLGILTAMAGVLMLWGVGWMLLSGGIAGTVISVLLERAPASTSAPVKRSGGEAWDSDEH